MLIQKSYKKLELRIVANDREIAFEKASNGLIDFFNSKNIFDVEIYLSDELPVANKISGKFNHVYKDF